MPKISRQSYDIAIVAVRRDHTSGVSVLKVYQPWATKVQRFEIHEISAPQMQFEIHDTPIIKH